MHSFSASVQRHTTFVFILSFICATIFIPSSIANADADAKTTATNKKWIDRGVSIEVTKPPENPKCARAGSRDVVHQFYTVMLEDGRVLHSNEDKVPFIFHLGMGECIEGIDIGMRGMCEGEERKLIIPPELGYGKEGAERHKIPPDTTLHFNIRLAKLVPANRMWIEKGVEIEVTKEIPNDKCKVKSQTGDTIHQMYTLKLEDGKVIDTNMESGQPFIFRLNHGEVIGGMDIGMQNMCEGEKRKVTIPSNLGYGDDGIPGEIPGGATLYFEIELRKLIPFRQEL